MLVLRKVVVDGISNPKNVQLLLTPRGPSVIYMQSINSTWKLIVHRLNHSSQNSNQMKSLTKSYQENKVLMRFALLYSYFLFLLIAGSPLRLINSMYTAANTTTATKAIRSQNPVVVQISGGNSVNTMVFEVDAFT